MEQIFTKADEVKLVNNAFAYVSQNRRISTSSGVQFEQNKDLGPASTIMGKLTQ